MRKTANYELNQWDPGDRILREEFNADNAKIDNAIAAVREALPIVFLREVVTTADAKQVDLELSDIDWNAYRHIRVRVEALGTNSYDGTLLLNGQTGNASYYGNSISGSSASYSSIAGWFSVSIAGATQYYTEIRLSRLGITWPQCESTTFGATDRTFSYCLRAAEPIRTLNLIHSGPGILAGSKFTIWGERL